MIQLNARNYAWNKRKHDTAQHSCVRHLGKALDKRDWRWHLTSAFSQRLRKYTFTAVHTKTHKRRFQIYPLWRAFSNLCVYGELFHRLRVDGRPKRIKKFAFTSVCVSIVFVWTGPRCEYIKMVYIEKKILFSRPSFGYIRFVMHLNENIWIWSVQIFTFHLYFFIYT